MEYAWDQLREIMTSRHCKRAFLGRPVPRDMLEVVLAAAANAPSPRNGQPWQVEVVAGAALDGLVARLCHEFDRKVPPQPDYPNRLTVTDQVVEDRARVAGAGVLRARGIARTDPDARQRHLRDNMTFYGAPTALVCHLPEGSVAGTFLEMGLFLQNVLLGLVACGLGACPQYSVAGYPHVLRDQLGLEPGRIIACTVAVGYPDPAAPVNAFWPPRATLGEYTRWHSQARGGDLPLSTVFERQADSSVDISGQSQGGNRAVNTR